MRANRHGVRLYHSMYQPNQKTTDVPSSTDARDATPWLPPDALPADVRAELERIGRTQREFQSTVAEKAVQAVGSAFPRCGPWYRGALLPWSTSIRRVLFLGDVGTHLRREVRQACRVPGTTAAGLDWEAVIRDLNTCGVWCLRRFGARVHVVFAFITLIDVEPDCAPDIRLLARSGVECVRRAYESWRVTDAGRSADHVILVIGSGAPFSEGVAPSRSVSYTEVMSVRSGDDSWTTRRPVLPRGSTSLGLFLRRLDPAVLHDRIVRVRAAIEDLLFGGYRGAIRLEILEMETGYGLSELREVALALQVSGEYSISQGPGQELAIQSHGNLDR